METSVKYQHVLIKPYTFDYYGKNTYPVGKLLATTKQPVLKDLYGIVLGHGANEYIPKEYVGLKKVTTTIVEEML